MNYAITFTQGAEHDLNELYDYISVHDSLDAAIHVLSKIEEQCQKLAQLPNRGHYVKELERISLLNYREVHFKPYRIIYQVIEHEVVVHAVLDSRRELESYLYKRLY